MTEVKTAYYVEKIFQKNSLLWSNWTLEKKTDDVYLRHLRTGIFLNGQTGIWVIAL